MYNLADFERQAADLHLYDVLKDKDLKADMIVFELADNVPQIKKQQFFFGIKYFLMVAYVKLLNPTAKIACLTKFWDGSPWVNRPIRLTAYLLGCHWVTLAGMGDLKYHGHGYKNEAINSHPGYGRNCPSNF